MRTDESVPAATPAASAPRPAVSVESLEAFNRTFPGGAAAFERQWLEHVQTRARAG